MGHTEWAMWANEQGVITSVGEYVRSYLSLGILHLLVKALHQVMNIHYMTKQI